MTALSLKNLSFGFQDTLILKNLSCTISKGSLTALIGPNGAGKSTLLKIICGFLRIPPGKVVIHDSSRVCYLPQRNEFDLTFPLTVEDVVSMGLWSRIGHFAALSPDLKQQIHEALEVVGLKGYEKFSLNQLSGGQLQRVLFARMIVQEGDILLLDEPFAAIDQATIKDLMVIIESWQKQGRTVIVVVHNMALVRQYFPTSLLLARSLIAFGPTELVLSQENVAEATYDI